MVPEAGELNKIVIRILKGQKSVKPAVHPYKLARHTPNAQSTQAADKIKFTPL